MEANRAALLKLLRVRFQADLPADLVQAIEQATEPDTLSRWFDTALTIPSLEAFRSMIQTAPTPPQTKSN